MLPRMLNFLLVPLQTRVFPKEEYASISELYGYAAFLNIVFLFGMETAFFRFVNKPGADAQRVFRAAQTVVISISTLFTIAFVLATPSLSQTFKGSNNTAILCLALTLWIDALVAIPFARLRSERKPLNFAVYKITNISLLIGLNLYFLVYAGNPSPGIELVFLANLIANAVYVLFFLRVLLQWRPLWDKQMSPELLQYSYPLVITGIAGTTNEMFSRIALNDWLPKGFYLGKSPEYMQGVFAACYKFSVFMSITVQAFRFAAEPFFFSRASDKNSPALFARVNHYFVLLACVIMVGICLNLDWLKFYVDKDSWQGLSIVPILLMGYIFLGIYFNMTVWFKLTDKTYFGTIITIFGAALTIGFNYWLIPQYGIVGSSVATVLCYFFMTVLCYGIGQRYYPIPYSIGKDFLLLVVTGSLVYVNMQIKIDGFWLSVTLRGFASLIIALAAFVFVRRNFTSSSQPSPKG
jgi:O-antigen/teichoic acid export membrane protein